MMRIQLLLLSLLLALPFNGYAQQSTPYGYNEVNIADVNSIIEILMYKFGRAIKDTGIKTIAIGGGVSANSGLRAAVEDYARWHRLQVFIPKRIFTTDNAAMIAVAGHYKYQAGDFCDITPLPSSASLSEKYRSNYV